MIFFLFSLLEVGPSGSDQKQQLCHIKISQCTPYLQIGIQTDGQMDGHHQTYYLPCFVIDN